jgi:hypothetical protein
MLGFGTFVLMLLGLVVELIKNSNKNDHLSLAELMVIQDY